MPGMSGKPSSATVRVGPAGWSYADWDGIVYPAPKPRGFDPLNFLARFFDVIEINSTFYHPANPKAAATWVRRVEANANFRFTAKLWRGFTHDPAGAGVESDAAFRDGLAPLIESGRLSAILMQFPQSFRPSAESFDRIAALSGRYAGLMSRHTVHPVQLVLEVRRPEWAAPETLDWLHSRGISFCNIDQPGMSDLDRAHPQTITLGPTAFVTAPVAYARFHGRNREAWFAHPEEPATGRATAGRDARYDYLYTAQELTPWVERIRKLASAAEEVYIILNNHFRGKAVVNAAMIRAMLDGAPAEVPQTLVDAYPQLEPVTRVTAITTAEGQQPARLRTIRQGRQRRLFETGEGVDRKPPGETH